MLFRSPVVHGLFVALAILPAVLPSACAVDRPSGVSFLPDIEYGRADGQSLALNLALPGGTSGRRPLVLVIHGGAWRGGHRSDHDDLARQLAEEGYVAATLGYRFCPRDVFPAQVQDVQRALRFLRAQAETYQIDPQRVGAVGFSAGAQLAMLLGTVDAGAGLDARVQAVVAFFGPTDFELPLTEPARPLVEDFLGGPLAEKRDVYRSASPVNHLDAGDAALLLLQGTDDPLVPHAHAVRMADAMQAAGVRGRVELIAGAGHADWDAAEFARCFDAMLDFFGDTL
jgi:acetyl esterase/lipase